MKNRRTFSIVLVAILGAWAYLLRLFDFPILPSAPFLKVDPSDLMVLVGLLFRGPVGALAVAGIRDGLNYMVKGGEMGIPLGACMSIMASMAYYLPVHWILKHFRHKLSSYLLAGVFATLSMTLILSIMNYFVALPLYIQLLNFPIDSISQYVLAFIMPFNLIKGILLGGCQLVFIPLLINLLRKRSLLYRDYRGVDSDYLIEQKAQFS